MAQRQRVQIVLPSGNTCHTSLREAHEMVRLKRAEWIEPGVSALTVTRHNFVDYSRKMGPRYEWLPLDSGGATVMQLV